MAIDVGLHVAANNLAWLLATHPDAELRDGAEAVRVAERMCEAVPAPPPVLLDTLSAAYAEAGRFDDALRTVDRAIAAAEKAGDGAAFFPRRCRGAAAKV